MELVGVDAMQLPAGYPARRVTMQLTRDGAQTPAPKQGRLLDRNMVTQAVFVTSFTATQTFLASAVDAGWLVVGIDETPSARAGARFVQIDSDITIALDLNDGSGSGGGGIEALLGASTRVERLPASREVVVLDRAVDGSWSVAGSTVTDDAGEALLDLKVTPSGRVYAVSVDDFGLPFQPDLEVSVGARVRPSVFGGWLYEITEAGTLPNVEPVWWPAAGDNASRPLGTARAIARRYYAPMARGPQPVEYV